MSVVQIYGLNSQSHCGYCGQNGSCSYGMNCSKMKSSDYEGLMLKGWRRSGSYYYKPHLPSSCCRLNTIRLDANKYLPNKKQRKVAAKFDAFLSGKQNKQVDKASKREETKAILSSLIPQAVTSAVETAMTLLSTELGIEPSPAFAKTHRNTGDKQVRFGAYTCSTPLILAAAVKKNNPATDLTPGKVAERMVALLAGILEGMQCHVSPQGHVNITDPNAVVFEKEEEKKQAEEKPAVQRNYTLTIVDSGFDEEAYALYRKYQINVHHDPPSKVSRSSYTNFLCESSLIKDKPLPDGPELGYGSYHFHHRLDGRLFAVGVCDILPSGLSSVYFFYDTDLAFLTVGTLGAVKELEWIRQRNHATFHYYYMGFYVDTCVKMRYKGEFEPSELLCPHSYNWVPLRACLQRKEEHGFLRLQQCTPDTEHLPIADDMNMASIPSIRQFIVENTMIVLRGKLTKLKTIPDSLQIKLVIYLEDALPYIGKAMLSKLLFAF